MGKQQAAPAIIKPLKPARELAALVTKLPKEERLRLEGYVMGFSDAHKPDQPTNRQA